MSEGDRLNGQETKVGVPLEEWVKDIAQTAGRAAGKEVMEEHVKSCLLNRIMPQIKEDHLKLDRVRLSLAKLIGMTTVGGGVGGLIVALIQWAGK